MNRIVVLIFSALLSFGISLSADAKERVVPFNYELSVVQEGNAATSGHKIFKVWSFGKKGDLTQEICMRNAIHGLLFRGLIAEDMGSQGSVAALVPDGYESHKDYFDAFFSSGDFLQFIQPASKGAQQAGDVVKMKKDYRVGLLVQVNLSALRKRLEKDGIIKGVRSLFRN
ncbi:MAG: hypothetical protein SPD54_12845 [Parabacteroides sp.]|nr:hypothetical protein [Parabacteroides sp.]